MQKVRAWLLNRKIAIRNAWLDMKYSVKNSWSQANDMMEAAGYETLRSHKRGDNK